MSTDSFFAVSASLRKMFLCVSVRSGSRVVLPFQGIELGEELTVGQLLSKIQSREIGEKFFVPFQHFFLVRI